MAHQRQRSQWHDPQFDLSWWLPEAMHGVPATMPARCNAKDPIMSKKKSVSAETASTSATARKQASAAKPKTKLARLETLLRRPDGATIEQISKSLDWQAHSVRGAMSGALKKKQGLTIASEKTDDGRRVYRITA
jgi:hypothetical protein